MAGYYSRKYIGEATVTAGTPVIIGPIDVSHLRNFALMYQNNNTAIGFLDLQVQAAFDSSGTAADLAPNWAQIPTATLPQPSALGATAVVITPSIDNAYKWIRLVGRTSSTAVQGKLVVTVAGIERFGP